MRARREVRVAAALLALALAGCGTSDQGASGGDAVAHLKDPVTPPASACDAGALATSVKADYLVPKAGHYPYAMKGTRRTLTQDAVTSPLPSPTTFVVTPVRSLGKLRCYSTLRRYSPDVADTTTFVVRGSDIYATKLEVFTRGKTYTVTPEPPIKVLDSNSFEWSGTFSGATNGRYAGNVLGRRPMDVNGVRERAIGVQLRLAFAGELRGTARTITWSSLKTNLPVLERSTQDRDVAGLQLHLQYEMRLKAAG